MKKKEKNNISHKKAKKDTQEEERKH